ncbi:unnamed protein product [Rotaria magnacalcarata]
MNVNVTTVQNQIKKKKCHGNRKDQRFRRKCRAKGMNSRKIEKLLRRRKIIHHKKKKNPTHNTMNSNNQPNHENFSSTEINSMRNLTKRKRDISVQHIKSNTRISKSTSSISVAQSKLKKMRRRSNLNIPTTTTIMNNTACKHYQRPIYLKRSPMIIIKMLTNIINYNFKKKEEQIFLCHRLDLLDKHYYLQVHHQLWQSYFDIGIQQHCWPGKSIYQPIDEYTRKTGNNLSRSFNVRNATLCKFLPKNFDQLEEFIAPMIYSPLNNDEKIIEVRNKRYKTIQEAKRIWLNLFLNSYEVQLQEYDQQYENEFL